MTETFYRQCVLVKGTSETTSWIPEKFAQKGRPVRLRLKTGKDEWDDGWMVSSVGARASGEQVSMMERDHTRTRKASDI
jgi:hypothetical protein